jgi:prophage DNA circulation protein
VTERIFDVRYTSPSDAESSFSYETIKRETELKTGVFTFPSKDGAHVQHQGIGAKSFPLTCIFSGSDCMDDADAFEAMLIERGVGELQIPYGIYKVVPTGKIERADDLVSGIGESLVNITFTETIVEEEGAVLEAVVTDEIAEQYEEFADAACENFATSLDTDDIVEQLAIVSNLNAIIQLMTDRLQSLMTGDFSKFADFLTSIKELSSNIQNLYKEVKDAAGKIESVYAKGLNVARLTLRVMKLPSEISQITGLLYFFFAEN